MIKKFFILVFCVIAGICALAMCTNSNANCLFFNGHYYTDQGSAPCPDGCTENSTSATFVDGVPAWWQNGHMYVRDYSKDCESNPWHIDWSKVPTPNTTNNAVVTIGGFALVGFVLLLYLED